MSPKKVFITYDHSHDQAYKELIKAWSANPNFEFSFSLESPDVKINSEDAIKVKQVLTRKLKQADYLLVIVGEKTHECEWVEWEIERAKSDDLKLKLAAIKIKHTNKSPKALLKSGTAYRRSFKLQYLIDVLEEANNQY